MRIIFHRCLYRKWMISPTDYRIDTVVINCLRKAMLSSLHHQQHDTQSEYDIMHP